MNSGRSITLHRWGGGADFDDRGCFGSVLLWPESVYYYYHVLLSYVQVSVYRGMYTHVCGPIGTHVYVYKLT